MGWAGALEGIFATFADRFSAIGLNLYQNFRSQPRLRRMQNAMIRILEPGAALEDSDIPGDAGEIKVMAFRKARSWPILYRTGSRKSRFRRPRSAS